MNKVITIIAVVLTFLFVGCAETATENTKEVSIENVIEKSTSEHRSPSEIAYGLRSIGAQHIPGIGNDTTNMKRYAENKNRASLNLGIYFADFEYSLIYRSMDEAKASVEGIKLLSNELGVSTELDSALVKSFDDSISEEERIVMLDKGLQNYRVKLNDNSSNVELLIVTGFYVEQFYQLLQIINLYPKDVDEAKRVDVMQKLYSRVEVQDVSLGQLLMEINKINSWSPGYKTFLGDLEKLQIAISKMKTDEEIKLLNSEEIVNEPSLVDVRLKLIKLREFVIQ